MRRQERNERHFWGFSLIYSTHLLGLWQRRKSGIMKEIEDDKSPALNSLNAFTLTRLLQTKTMRQTLPCGPRDSDVSRRSRSDKLTAETEILAEGMGDSCLMLGLCYRLHGKKIRAKSCFRASVLEGSACFIDEDPTTTRMATPAFKAAKIFSSSGLRAHHPQPCNISRGKTVTARIV